MGARKMVRAEAAATAPQEKKRVFKRSGGVTAVEKNFVAQFVADQPAELRPRQVTALATLLNRNLDTVRSMISEAKAHFQSNAKRYSEIHIQACETALASEDPKALKAAIDGAQWALEKVSDNGERVIEPAKAGPVDTGTKILVGINVGGVTTPTTAQVVEISGNAEVSGPPQLTAVITPSVEG